MTFPSDWPEGCPPQDAEDANVEVFRLVKMKPPTSEDFRSFTELGKRLRKPPECPCMPYGLSVFRDRGHAEQMGRLYPFLGKYIAQGTLSVEHGVTMLTKGQRPTHTTWWPADGIERHMLFDQVQEIV